MYKDLHETLTQHLLKNSLKMRKAKIYHKLREISALIKTLKYLYQAQLFIYSQKFSHHITGTLRK